MYLEISQTGSMLNLEDLVPERATFTSRLTKKEYTLRPFTLEDEIWLGKVFGDSIQSIFRDLKMKEICQIAYHQLEDRSDFVKQKVTVINEKGDQASEEIGGVELLQCLVSGMKEKLDLVHALLATIGISRPVMEKLSGTPEDVEKKSPATTKNIKKKGKRTGLKS